MKKYLKVIILFITILLIHNIWMSKVESVPVMTEEPLYRAIQATGAEVESLTIHSYAVVTMKENEVENLDNAINYLAEHFELKKEEIVKEIIQNSKECSIKICGNVDGQNISITLKKLFAENIADKIHLSIKIEEDHPESYNLIYRKEKLLEIFRKFFVEPHITTCLEGYLDGKLRKGAADCCIRDALDSIGADMNSRVDGGNYISVTGYTSLIDDKIIAGNIPVNINMAIRYHTLDNRTYITIGSPLILVEY